MSSSSGLWNSVTIGAQSGRLLLPHLILLSTNPESNLIDPDHQPPSIHSSIRPAHVLRKFVSAELMRLHPVQIVALPQIFLTLSAVVSHSHPKHPSQRKHNSSTGAAAAPAPALLHPRDRVSIKRITTMINKPLPVPLLLLFCTVSSSNWKD